MEIIDECIKLVFVMVILFFCILTYIRVKRIIKKKKCRVGTWYNLLGVSWMEADRNVRLAVNCKKGVLARQKYHL